ncbi:hypothetical protein O181_052622 [Austropuccinia psidii MF-1]|uniref:Uncharacterized protein n=1 Tax=Austropuccinia psidii MF-1 TaxID=1389203 RepID=A0A9Q3HQQ4_9BASI|nr:hypothetical protein [Austropuccinia psidii MF-1]
MSKGDQIILMSYANLVPVMKLLSRLKPSEIPTSNPYQQPQQAFTLFWCSGAHHSRWWLLSQPCVITPPMGVYGKYSQPHFMGNWPCHQFYGQLDHLGPLWPLQPTAHSLWDP